MLPIAMITGGIFHAPISKLSFLTPVLLFCMLFLTFCKISLRDMVFKKLHLWMLLFQVGGSILIYYIIAPFNSEVAQGTMICVLAPTATAAAVITGLLGGNIGFLATFVFLSNVTVAITAPFIFSFIGIGAGLPFWPSFQHICLQIVPILLIPLLAALLIQYLLPKIHGWLLSVQMASFYLWAIALTIVTATTVTFLIEQENPHYRNELILVGTSLIICLFQFWTGRKLGRKYGDIVAGGQGLGQKNTILAIWISQMYFSPAAAVGPAAYVLWQNLINSWQLWKKQSKEKSEELPDESVACSKKKSKS